MNFYYKIACLVCILSGSLNTASGQQKVMEKLPDIVLIMADDMGYECVGANGNTEYRTPNLDRLAGSGIRFDYCYSQPLCTPSRVKLMTGQSNARNYVNFEYLRPGEKTFAHLLKEVGYATCIAGKWQLNGVHHNYPGNQDVTRPNHFGFDEYCLWQLNKPKKEGERYANPLLNQNGKELERDTDAYGPQVIADFLKDFIDRNAGNPFFIYYPMVLPHDPFVPTPDSPEWAYPSRRYENDTIYFDDMIAYIDKIVGQLEAKLREKGVWEKTLLIFTGDNGTNRSVITSTKNGRVKGAKGLTINTGNHVPLIISWPQRIKKGRAFNGLIDFADFLPTLADVTGINPAEYLTDGTSFFPVINGEKSRAGKEEIFIHYSPRWGKFDHSRWVLNDTYKLYRDGRFFNTKDDPLEKNILSEFSKNEKKIKDSFNIILSDKEKEIPFGLNDSEYKVAK